MLEYDFEESIGFWVMMTARMFERAMNDELAQHGITYRQCQVLGWLALEGDLTQSELADRMRVEAPTLVGILDRMERNGWIRRQTSRMDRRKKRISPTPQVQPVWKKITRCARRVRARAVRDLNEDELAVVKRVLARIQENLKTKSIVEETVS
ncbi:MAG: transcriptional regulator [Gemmatales bacterium]|nr:MAG: transcriptional regulator [Gemmatales bacterium]